MKNCKASKNERARSTTKPQSKFGRELLKWGLRQAISIIVKLLLDQFGISLPEVVTEYVEALGEDDDGPTSPLDNYNPKGLMVPT